MSDNRRTMRRKTSPFQSKLGPISTGLSMDPAESLLIKKEIRIRQSFDSPEARESFRLAAFKPQPGRPHCLPEGEPDLVDSLQGLQLSKEIQQEGAVSLCPSPRMSRTDRPLGIRGPPKRSASGPLVIGKTQSMDDLPARSFSAPNIASVKVADMWADIPDNAPPNPFAMAAAQSRPDAHPAPLSYTPVRGANPSAGIARSPFAEHSGGLTPSDPESSPDMA